MSGLREAIEALAEELTDEIEELRADAPPVGVPRVAHMYRTAGLSDARDRLTALLAAHPDAPEGETREVVVKRVFENARENTDEIEGSRLELPDGSCVWLHTSAAIDAWLVSRRDYELHVGPWEEVDA